MAAKNPNFFLSQNKNKNEQIPIEAVTLIVCKQKFVFCFFLAVCFEIQIEIIFNCSIWIVITTLRPVNAAT